MLIRPGLEEFKKTLEELPVFVVMDYLYTKNADSPIASGKPLAQQYQNIVTMVENIMGEAATKEIIAGARDMPFTALFSLAEMILYCIIKVEDIMTQVMIPGYERPYFPAHCANVAFLSCKIGINLKLSFRELTELGVAALLHDIGMTKIHPAYYEHDRQLSEEERKVVETHPELGRRFLEKLEKDFPWLLRAIIEEHKRLGANGYPQSTEDEPHIYSRIIGLCDSFEALTHQRSFRKAYHPGDAIKIIIEGKSNLYDRKVLRAMIESLALFPVGSLVQLNTNTIAEVIRSIDGSPLRPVVKIVDTDRATGDSRPRIVDLTKEKSLFITGLVYDERYYIPDQAKAL